MTTKAKTVLKKRVEVYKRICVDFQGNYHQAGDICTSEDAEYLNHLTEIDALKTEVR